MKCAWCEMECDLPDDEARNAGWFFVLGVGGWLAFCGVDCMLASL